MVPGMCKSDKLNDIAAHSNIRSELLPFASRFPEPPPVWRNRNVNVCTLTSPVEKMLAVIVDGVVEPANIGEIKLRSSLSAYGRSTVYSNTNCFSNPIQGVHFISLDTLFYYLRGYININLI